MISLSKLHSDSRLRLAAAGGASVFAKASPDRLAPNSRLKPLPRLAAAVLLLVMCFGLRATVVEKFEFEELVAASALIFQGEVVGSEQEIVDGLVYTRVRFRIDEFIKGDFGQPEISLRFLGGEVPGSRVEVSGQYLPEIGQLGVWFVQDPTTDRVNPLTGWHQGAFLIEATEDGRRYLDLRERPDLVLFNARGDPLARKMLQAGFTEAEVSERFPEYQRFSLRDFIDAIRALE